jgi:L-serine dehydratase
MVMYHYENGMDRRRLINGLAIAGLFGNVIKTRATISGATGGCQAEIGTACAMAAALNAYLAGLSNKLISYAAEIGMEHNLGMTCDPVGGYVQIPCIERNGVAALRSYDAAVYAQYLGSIRDNRISFDMVVDTMNYTGHKLARELRETSLGGLALALPVADKAENNEK